MNILLLLAGLFCTACLRMPDAAFSVIPDSPAAGTEVVFINQSKDALRYEWIFGNGKSSTLEHPTTVYDTPGVYNVTLKAKHGLRTDRMTKSVIVTP
jgi:PKD repeat protein